MCGILFCSFCSPLPRPQVQVCSKHESESVSVSSAESEIDTDTSISKHGILGLQDILDDQTLDNRGPDVSKIHRIPALSDNFHGCMKGCVLHLRGELTPQPLVDGNGNALLWNAEIFGGIEVPRGDNDTQILLHRLVKCTSDEDVLKTLEQVQGPWAIIFWQEEQKTVWFGRDIFGRRSLLWHLPVNPNDPLVLSSVVVGDLEFKEMPSVGIFKLDFSAVLESTHCGDSESQTTPVVPSITLYPWYQCRWPGTAQMVTETPENDLSSYIPSSVLPIVIDKQNTLKYWIPEMCKSISISTKKEQINHQDENKPVTTNTTVIANEHADLIEQLDRIYKGEDTQLKDLSLQLADVLKEAVMRRVNCLPLDHQIKSAAAGGLGNSSGGGDTKSSTAKIAVLFSGGLDSSVIAALLDKCLPHDEKIDLLNVAFEQPAPKQNNTQKKRKHFKQNKKKKCQNIKELSTDAAPVNDLQQGAAGSEQLSAEKKEKEDGKEREVASKTFPYRFGSGHLEYDLEYEITFEDNSENDVENNNSVAEVKQSHSSTKSSSVVNMTCDSLQIQLNKEDSNSTICQEGVDFSNKCNIIQNNSSASSTQPENVSNENEKSLLFDPYDVPDRRTGRIAFSELNPNRRWNFVEINVSQAELQELRSSRIGKLIYPLQTVLDDSIGCAVWFAARGRGILANGDGGPIVSTAKVILCGMAADEQFAGYSRHRAHYNKLGEESLVRQLEQEMWRISTRNLGRDDRIIADLGKEARFPFLDEMFTEFVSKIPVHVRANLDLPRGLGEKLLLRLSAYGLGLYQTSCQPKRAIQFGSKIAKLDDSKEKGSDICQRLL